MLDPVIRKQAGLLMRCALALGLVISAGHATQAQEQQNQTQDQTQTNSQYPSQDRAQDPPPPPPRQAQMQTAPARNGAEPQRTNRADRPPDGQHAPPPPYEAPPPPPPATLTIPAGTVIVVRTNDFLSTDHSKVGDMFTAMLDQPVVVNGWVVARRGQTVTGQVRVAKKAGLVKGTSQLGLEVTDLTLVDGQQAQVSSQLWQGSGGTSHGQDAATIGATTGTGALIGAVAGAGKGAAIGAGAGAAAGIGAVLLTRGRSTVLPPETQLSFRITNAVNIDTAAGQQAFLPVIQEDFDTSNGGDQRHTRHVVGGYPYGYYGYYGYPYYGFYDGFWGPRFYGGYGFRGGYGGFHGGFHGHGGHR